MKENIKITVHFMDGTSISLRQPESVPDPMNVVAALRKGLDSNKLVAEVDGNLLVIPGRNVKYVQVSPCPKDLPQGIGIMLGASVVD